MNIFDDVPRLQLADTHPLRAWHERVGRLFETDTSQGAVNQANAWLAEVVDEYTSTGGDSADDLLEALTVRQDMGWGSGPALPQAEILTLQHRLERARAAIVPSSWSMGNALQFLSMIDDASSNARQALAWQPGLSVEKWSEEEAARHVAALGDWHRHRHSDGSSEGAVLRLELLRSIAESSAADGLAAEILVARLAEFSGLAVSAARRGNVSEVQSIVSVCERAVEQFRMSMPATPAVEEEAETDDSDHISPLFDALAGCADALLAVGLRREAYVLLLGLPRRMPVGGYAPQLDLLANVARRWGVVV